MGTSLETIKAGVREHYKGNAQVTPSIVEDLSKLLAQGLLKGPLKPALRMSGAVIPRRDYGPKQ